MKTHSKIYIAGHHGMVGSAINRKLKSKGYHNPITRTHSELEVTNEAYAVAKIAGIWMRKYYNQQYGTNFISVMPTNLYGPNDNYDLETSHVIAALIRKFHEAKTNNELQVVVWGTGVHKREFLHVDDMADACACI